MLESNYLLTKNELQYSLDKLLSLDIALPVAVSTKLSLKYLLRRIEIKLSGTLALRGMSADAFPVSELGNTG
jgi:hypothetical protein